MQMICFKKTKYIWLGVAVAAVLIPLTCKAVDTIPLTFKKGDVISAEVFNSLLGNVNNVVSGFSSTADLNGVWSCTVYKNQSGTVVGTNQCTNDGSLLQSKTANLTFNSTALTWSWSGGGSLNDCGTGLSTSGTYDVKAGLLVTSVGIYPVTRQGPDKFIWYISNSMPPSGFNVCVRTSAVPAPVSALAATVTGSGKSATVVLSWTDSASDQTGYIVKRAPTSTGIFETASTISSASTTSYTDTGLASGTYQYSVMATNTNGNSISSSVIQVTIP